MLVFVLDTSAVTDNELRKRLTASSLEEVVEKLGGLMRIAVTRHGARFYVTPSMLEELTTYLERNGVSREALKRLTAWLIVKAPSLLEIKIPAIVMASYVEEIQRRITKGLRVAEEAVKKAVREQADLASIIHSLREKYREAMRRGIVDSVIDFNAAILALEVKGIMVTGDQGLKKLCETLGVMAISPEHFADMLEEYAGIA